MFENIDNTNKAHEEFFNNNFTGKQASKILKMNTSTMNRLLTKIKIPDDFPRSIYGYHNETYMYSKKEVYDLKDYNDFILKNFIKQDDAKKYLDITTVIFRRIVKYYNLEVKQLKGFYQTNYFLKDDIEKIKRNQKEFFKQQIAQSEITSVSEAQKEFLNNHLTRNQVCEILNAGKYNINKFLTKVEIPDIFSGAKLGCSNLTRIMYNKKEIYELKNHNDLFLKNHITQADAIKYLDVSLVVFREIVKDFNLQVKQLKWFSTKNFFLKDDIENIKIKQKEFWQEYISRREIKSIHTSKTYIEKIFGGFETYEIPSYAKIWAISRSCGGSPDGYRCYKRDVVLKKIDSMTKKNQEINICGPTNFDTFKLRLNVYADALIKFNSSTYTKEKWFKFVDSKLKETQSLRTINSYISNLIKITICMNNVLQEYNIPEIYALNSNQVALIYNWATSMQKRFVGQFFTVVEEDVRLQLLKSGISTAKGFKLDKIFDKTKDSNEEKPKNSKIYNNIYDIKVYANLFQFLTNIKLHTKNSIDAMLKDDNIIYPSLWLYLMLHLNNAWRHGDVANFPRLHIYDLLFEFEIDGLDWFKDNELTLEQSRRIITRVINEEFRISKTQVNGHFFSSDVLAPVIATAILIIEAFLVSKGVLDSKAEYLPLLNFNNKYNQPTEAQLKNFLKSMDNCKSFIFGSKKMNKSVMTYLYHLANISGDDNALKYAQTLRNHIDESSPLSYVDFDLKRIEGLTEQLFQRGEFGYIPSLLIQRLEGKPLSFEKITEQVYLVNNTFNGVFRLESTIGFLNTIKHERVKVLKILENQSLQECQEILTNLFTQKLPSKEKDIQCLVSKQGCQRTDKKCFDCEYHIPSIYALTTLCKAIIANIKEYHKTVNAAKKMKIALCFYREIEVFKEATCKYGSEYVYSCLGLNRKELLDELQEIPEPDEFFELLLPKPTENQSDCL